MQSTPSRAIFSEITDFLATKPTPEGRITVQVLQVTDVDRVENRQILAELGE